MKTVQTLIAMARAKVHTDAELARAIGVTRQNLNDMKNGSRAISPETIAALCDVLQLTGEEAREWLAIAIIENPKNASRVELLKRALFACWALGVVAAPSTILTNDARANEVAVQATSTEAVTGLKPTPYTLSRIWNALRLGSVAGLCMTRLARFRSTLARAATVAMRPAPIAAAG